MSRSRIPFTIAAAVAAAAKAAVPGCGSRGNSPGPTVKPASSARVSSSIAEGADLTNPVRWQAYVTGVPPGGVVSVRFMLVIRAVSDRQCADRNSFWNGTFTQPKEET